MVSVIWWTVFWIQPTRLFLGTAFVEYIVQALGESEVFTFWNKYNLKSSVLDWLSK